MRWKLFCLALCAVWTLRDAPTAEDGARGPVPAVGDWSRERTVFRPIPLDRVRLLGFLGTHADSNNRSSLAAGLKSPVAAAFEARARGEDPPAETRRLATDSDFYKWLEGACYAIASDDDDGTLAEIRREADRYAGMLAGLQEPDGFLGTRLSPRVPYDERTCHDLYVAGHLFEAAVAHHRATGSRTLLQTASRLADFYHRGLEQGHPYFKIVGTREHPEVELALVRLWRATGERRHLEFAAALARMSRLGPTLADVHAGGGRTHAVRLCYLLAGAAELYIETGEEAFLRHLDRLWKEIVATRMYITGGIGYGERVPPTPYDLPQCLEDNPNRDIAETCASVAMMMLSWRLHAITGESRFMDVVETILYNHYLGALSADHLGIFYYNPLRRVGDLSGKTDHGGSPVERTRLPGIHSTACCIPNAWRFFAQLPEYVFSAGDGAIAVNLYTDAVARHRFRDGTEVGIDVKTRYPVDGTVRVTLSPERPARFALHLRIPLWCGGATVSVAGGDAMPATAGAYHILDREWKPGEEVVLELPMEPVAVISRPEIRANGGQVAFRRGPVVYCLERQDAGGLDLARAVVVLDREDPSRSARAVFDPDIGLVVLEVRAGERRAVNTPSGPYFPAPPFAPANIRRVRLVPFHFRANREADTRWITWIPYE